MAGCGQGERGGGSALEEGRGRLAGRAEQRGWGRPSWPDGRSCIWSEAGREPRAFEWRWGCSWCLHSMGSGVRSRPHPEFQGLLSPVSWSSHSISTCLSFPNSQEGCCWVGRKVHNGFFIPSYGETRTKFLVNPISHICLKKKKKKKCLMPRTHS